MTLNEEDIKTLSIMMIKIKYDIIDEIKQKISEFTNERNQHWKEEGMRRREAAW